MKVEAEQEKAETVIRTSNSLPIGWKRITIAEVADINPPLPAKDSIPDALEVQFLPMKLVEEMSGRIDLSETKAYHSLQKKSYSAFINGDVIFAKVTPCMENGKSAVAVNLKNGIAFGSSEFHVLRPKDGLLNQYLYRFISQQAFRNEAERSMTGAVGLRRVPKQFIENYKIPLPPLHMQKRIVAEIEKQFSRLDEAVTNLKRVKANLKRYRASVLKAAVEGRLVETEAEIARREGREYETGKQLLERILETRRREWKGKGPYKEPVAPDDSELPELPEGWAWGTVEQMAWASGYGTSVKCSYESNGLPVLRIPNIDRGEIDLTDLKYAPADFEIDPKEALQPGDMLIIRTNGSKSLIGRAALVMKSLRTQTAFASYLIRFRFLGNTTLWQWLAAYWHSADSQSWIQSRAVTSAGQNNISMSVLATAPIPLPPLAEQQRIVAEVDRRLSLVRETEAQVEANLKRAERLRQSVLQKAFSGELVRDEVG